MSESEELEIREISFALYAIARRTGVSVVQRIEDVNGNTLSVVSIIVGKKAEIMDHVINAALQCLGMRAEVTNDPTSN